MEALSDIICLDDDLWLTNLLKGRKNIYALRSEKITIWCKHKLTDLHMQTFCSPSVFILYSLTYKYKALVQLASVIVNGLDSLTCTLGNGGGGQQAVGSSV